MLSCKLKMKVQIILSVRFHTRQRKACKVEKKILQRSYVMPSVSQTATATLGDVFPALENLKTFCVVRVASVVALREVTFHLSVHNSHVLSCAKSYKS